MDRTVRTVASEAGSRAQPRCSRVKTATPCQAELDDQKQTLGRSARDHSLRQNRGRSAGCAFEEGHQCGRRVEFVRVYYAGPDYRRI